MSTAAPALLALDLAGTLAFAVNGALIAGLVGWALPESRPLMVVSSRSMRRCRWRPQAAAM